MNRNLFGKMISAIAMGVLLGTYIQHDYVHWGQRGLAEFLAHQTVRFHHYMSPPQPAPLTAIGSMIVMAGALAVYEAIAWAANAILGRNTDPGR